MGSGQPRRVLRCDDPDVHRDLARLNEDAIRHDIALAIEHGFTYTLLMTETTITPEEARGSPPSHARQPPGACALFSHASFGDARGERRGAETRRARGRGPGAAGLSAAVLADDRAGDHRLDERRVRGDGPRRDALRAPRVGLRAHPPRRHVGRPRPPRARHDPRTSSRSSPSRASHSSPASSRCTATSATRSSSAARSRRTRSRSWASWTCSSPGRATPVDERLVPRDVRAGARRPLGGGDGALLGGSAGAPGQRRPRRPTSPGRPS